MKKYKYPSGYHIFDFQVIYDDTDIFKKQKNKRR